MMPCSRPSCRPAGVGELGFDWGAFISEQVGSWSKTGQNILTSQNIPRGVYTSGPGGTTYVQPEGSQVTLPVGAGSFQAQASPGFGIVLVGGAALLLVFMLARK